MSLFFFKFYERTCAHMAGTEADIVFFSDQKCVHAERKAASSLLYRDVQTMQQDHDIYYMTRDNECMLMLAEDNTIQLEHEKFERVYNCAERDRLVDCIRAGGVTRESRRVRPSQ